MKALVLFAAMTLGVCSGAEAGVSADALAHLRAEDKITIVVTDSGLGGLSVIADATRKLGEWQAFGEVDLIFFNALFTTEGGYNSLRSRATKIAIFDRALKGLNQRYSPDIVFVACNTLSVLCPETEFLAEAPVPVVDIVDLGVDLIADRLAAGPDDGSAARVILFATETTVTEGTHRDALTAAGIPGDRIIAQQCPELAAYIELGYDGMETEFLVDAYVAEALAAAGPITGPLFVSFNCTHYGYALPAWRKAFAARGVEVAGYLNPNTDMIDVLLPDSTARRQEPTVMRVRVVSMVDISPERQDSIGRWLHETSPQTETALRNFELYPELFEWKDLVDGPVE